MKSVQKCNYIFIPIVVAGVLIGHSCTAGTRPANDTVAQQYIHKTGIIQNQAVDEASGMAYSRVNPDLLWIVNDSGDQPVIYAVGTDGSDRGQMHLDDAENQDWEDLASFRLQHSAYLLVADVGDNQAQRPFVILYILKEPQIGNGRLTAASRVNWEQKIQFTYADGPRDCEAVAVDTTDRKILLLTKRDRPPVLYELPLDLAARTQTQVALRLTTVETIPPVTAADITEDPLFGRFRSRPTAMDISSDGKLALVQTYKYAYYFRKTEPGSWAATFAARPKTILEPRLKQTEAACFGPDNLSIYITSEKRPAPLYRITIQKGDNL